MLKPAISVTLVVFSVVNHTLMVMMEKDDKEEIWHLLEKEIDFNQDKNLENAAKRVFKDHFGSDTLYLEQVQTIGSNDRVPEKWSVSVNYYCLLSMKENHLQFIKPNMKWIKLSDLPMINTAVDYNTIIETCLQRLQNKSLYTSLPIFLLPSEFTLTELQKTYEIVLGFKMEKKSFRRRLLDAGFLEETGNIRRASHRPAQLYRLSHPQPYFFARIIEGVREGR